MIILGLAGPARAGKDSVADYLVERYGFVKLSFAHALREEVRIAYGLEDQSLFLDGTAKDVLTSVLSAENCDDPEFVTLLHDRELVYAGDEPLTPRQVLQWWGTEYRRAQDGNYWVKRVEDQVIAYQGFYPEQRPQHFVVSDVRFENEREWITTRGLHDDLGQAVWYGNLWHIRRGGINSPGQGHASAAALPVLPGERELYNNDSLENLCKGVDLLMSTSAPVVRVEPMEEDERPGGAK